MTEFIANLTRACPKALLLKWASAHSLVLFAPDKVANALIDFPPPSPKTMAFGCLQVLQLTEEQEAALTGVRVVDMDTGTVTEYATGASLVSAEISVFEKLKNLVKSNHGFDITLTDAWCDTGADSLDLLEILMDIEETFALEIADEVAEKFKTVHDTVLYVSERQLVPVSV